MTHVLRLPVHSLRVFNPPGYRRAHRRTPAHHCGPCPPSRGWSVRVGPRASVRAGRKRPKSSCAYVRTSKERPYLPLPCDVPTSLKLLLYTQTDTQPIAYRKAVLAVRFPVSLALDDCPALLPTSVCVEAASPGWALTLN